ncbi:MAG: methyl-accepting chemotaxis protein, partial [Sneathiella sp.]
ALDNCAANIMVAGADNNIIYCNKSLQTLLSESEGEIGQEIANFNPQKIEKYSLASFCSSTTFQQNTACLARGGFGGKTFNLTSSPVVGEDKVRLGTTLEWVDITDELLVQREVDQMVSAVVEGDFSKQLSLDGKQGFMRSLAEAMNRLNDTIKSVMDDTSKALSALAAGDLTHQIEKDYKGTYESLKEGSNTTAQQLQEIVSKVTEAIHSITQVADEMSSGSTDLSSRTQSQASMLEETVAAMRSLEEIVSETAKNADHANKLTEKVLAAANQGKDVATQAVEAMSEIEASSEQVGQIIGVIDTIAFQTNLLALNATVEAARAGEAGKGFAVVADEVRVLAQRTADAAKDVKELVTNSSEQITSGVERVNNTGNSLMEMGESIQNIAEVIDKISVASNEQAAGITQTNTALGAIDEMTQQNSAMVEESSAAAHSLKDQSKGMSDLISFFSVEAKHA